MRPARSVQEELLSTYGKSILFDYSYRYFYGDGYGKTFRVLNLKKASAIKAHELMLGGLLIFYQQAMLHRGYWEEARTYNIEKPLWVLLGTSVSRKRPDEKDTTKTAEEERTDVGEVVAFLRRFLEDPDWAVDRIAKTISGKSGFAETDAGTDLFEKHIKHLSGDDGARPLQEDLPGTFSRAGRARSGGNQAQQRDRFACDRGFTERTSLLRPYQHRRCGGLPEVPAGKALRSRSSRM